MIHVDAKQYTTGAEMIAAAQLVKRRIMGVRPYSKLSQPTAIEVISPTEREWIVQHRQHMVDYAVDRLVKHYASNTIEPQNFVAEKRGGRWKTAKIIEIVAKYYGVNVLDIKSNRRTAQVVKPRQIAMYLTKTTLFRSLPEIGRLFGGRDHTTVLHAIRKIGGLIESDSEMRGDVEELLGIMRGQHENHG